MKSKSSAASAPTALKWAVAFLSILLTFLWIWLLGFVLQDIGDLRGPDTEEVMERYVDDSLVQRVETLKREIASIEVQIRRQQEIQSNLRSSMDNARATMEQMMNLHRLSLEQGVNPTESQQEALATSQQRFIEAQQSFEEANTAIADSNQRKFTLNQELNETNRQITDQREPAQEELKTLRKRHQYKVASLKLAFIVPIFLVAGFLVYRRRQSLFRPIYLSMLIASFWKVGGVMFAHFPREFFKYIAIAAAIALVLAFLVWTLRRMARPSIDLLVKRYREAYQRHHCPICDYPIMRGVLKQAVWTRKGPKGPAPAGGPFKETEEDAPYACPSCGSRLFETCSSCGKTRHSLLPFCDHCGQKTEVLPEAGEGGSGR